MSNSSPKHIKGLVYRCQHRGVKELDLLLGGFAQQNLAQFTDTQVEVFEKLLECPENDLLDWVTGVTKAPAEYDTDVLEKLKEYARQL